MITYFNYLPNELIEILFFKLKSDVLSGVSDNISLLYDIYIDNIHKFNYAPINIFKVLNNTPKIKMNLINKLINNHYINLELSKFDEIKSSINSIKYIFYAELYDDGNDTIYNIMGQTNNDKYINIKYYAINAGLSNCIDIDINNNWKQFIGSDINDNMQNILLYRNSYITDININFRN